MLILTPQACFEFCLPQAELSNPPSPTESLGDHFCLCGFLSWLIRRGEDRKELMLWEKDKNHVCQNQFFKLWVRWITAPHHWTVCSHLPQSVSAWWHGGGLSHPQNHTSACQSHQADSHMSYRASDLRSMDSVNIVHSWLSRHVSSVLVQPSSPHQSLLLYVELLMKVSHCFSSSVVHRLCLTWSGKSLMNVNRWEKDVICDLSSSLVQIRFGYFAMYSTSDALSPKALIRLTNNLWCEQFTTVHM